MSDIRPTAMFEVQLDLYIARRQRMHSVFDPDGNPVFHDKLILNVMEWLADKGVRCARFTDDETTYIVTFEPVAVQDNQPSR